MDQALKSSTIPFLRECGFKGSYPHFRRGRQDRIDLLTFQFDRDGGGFVVEIARCPPEGVTMSWGKFVAPTKVTAHDVSKRIRLGARPPNEDHWFRYGMGNPSIFDVLAKQVIVLVKSQATEWWNQEVEQIVDGNRPSTPQSHH